MSTSDELTGRERVLDAAARLMADRGYAGTSISAICSASGLPPSSVYWHFRNKEGVLQAVLDRAARRALGEFVETTSGNFQFLLVLGLREGRATELTTAVLRRVRGHILGWLRGQLTEILEVDEDEAGELARLVVAVANGIQIARWVQGEEAPFPADQLAIALVALAGAAPRR
jgi:AcrR family transcriptional regulator